MAALRPAPGREETDDEPFACPAKNLNLVSAPSYGTVVFQNRSMDQRLNVPMHVGFFQPGAQNHATSRALVLNAGETMEVNDCFCVPAAQGWAGQLKMWG